MTCRGHKGSLLLIPLMYLDEVVSTPKVQLGEDSSSSKLFQGCRDERKRVMKFNCYLVECLVIYARLLVLVLPGNKEKAGSRRRSGMTDEALLQCLLDILLHGLLFGHGERIYLASGHWFTGQDVDGTVP